MSLMVLNVDDEYFDNHDYDDTDDDADDDTDDDTDAGGRGNRRPLPGGAVGWVAVGSRVG